MTAFEMSCSCGWSITTNEISTFLAASKTHDEDCALSDSEGDA